MASGRRWDDSRNAAEEEEDWDRDMEKEGGAPISYLAHLKANPNPKVIRQCPAHYKGAQRKRWYAENRVYVSACEEADRLGLPRPPPPGTPPKGPVKPDKPAAQENTHLEPTAREKRQQAAAQREQLRPLKQKLAKNEKDLNAASAELEAVQSQLADAGLYDAERKDELAALLRQEGELKQRAGELEETWLELQESLEELEKQLAAAQ